MHQFDAEINIIGINPFVYVPEKILQSIFREAGKDKGKIPIRGTINGDPYQQTLVKYQGDWRLYVNTSMLKNSPKRIGEVVRLTLAIDSGDRTIKPHQKLIKALHENQEAKNIFDKLSPSLRHEIVRYIANLKTEASIDNNVIRAIDFLLGKGRFIGRDKP
ncbi:DUF1905 domain-containing protein [Olivibacter sp. CPCC 100613]|uniref:DUF1905 domain-containing protein n=1 Tax=Olivibacter sp. CPCC 100613 TaxID=3079931 RepID=UPI002FFB30FF